MTNEEIKKYINTLVKEMNSVRDIQKKISACVIRDVGTVLIYEVDDFIRYAEALECNVHDNNYVSEFGNISIGFAYGGYEFSTFATQEEYEKIKEKVLPPTKVTEPIHEKQ